MSVGAPPRVLLAGVSGYGARHLERLLHLDQLGLIRLVALVDVRWPDGLAARFDCCSASPLMATDLADALAQALPTAAVVATPPHMHAAMARLVLGAGVALYLEKPPVPTIDELDELILLNRRFPVRCEVGFQTTRRTVDALDAVVAAGTLGRVDRITGWGALCRPDSYYQRAAWAGRWFDGRTPILDGPLFNPLAHALHSAVTLAHTMDARWEPDSVEVDAYSVRAIDGDDTTSLRVRSRYGPDVTAVGTTASDEVREPAVTAIGDRGSATYRIADGLLSVTTAAGTSSVSSSDPGSQLDAFLHDVAAEPDPMVSLSATRAYVVVVDAAVEAAGEPHRLSEVSKPYTEKPEPDATPRSFTAFPGLASGIDNCVRSGALFGEAELGWGLPPRRIEVAGYARFHHPRLLSVHAN